MTLRVEHLLSDLSAFSQLHQVQDKDSKKPRAFIPSPMQRKIFAAVEAGHKRIIVIKARQVYATTGCKMVLHWMATATRFEAMHAVISMRDDSATALLNDARRWLQDPPALLQRPIRTQARGCIQYDDTGASLQAFTSRSNTGLRSFTPAAAVSRRQQLRAGPGGDHRPARRGRRGRPAYGGEHGQQPRRFF